MRERVSLRGTRENGESAIQSVARAAHILGFFTVGRPRRSLSELTARLGVSERDLGKMVRDNPARLLGLN